METRPIEQTGKVWKLIQAISVLLIIYGVIAIFTASSSSAGTFFFIGLVGVLIGKFGAWWYHE